MPAKKTIDGPYEVINIAATGDTMYEVVEILDEERNYTSLRPRKTYVNRQSAYGMAARLNRRWQVDHAMDDENE